MNNSGWLSSFGNAVNNSFYFVVDKLIDLQTHFIKVAWDIGKVVLLIAILTAALNYALTGQGLKENVIKILKAALFFIIVTAAYPKIIGFISSWTYQMAYDSIYPSVAERFKRTVSVDMQLEFDISNSYSAGGNGNKWKAINQFTYEVDDTQRLFPNLVQNREHPIMNYSTIAPAAVINLIFILATDCFTFSEKQETGWHFPDLGRLIKGMICAFFIIFTGIFALLEYLMCVMEFMLVSSVGVILLPLSMWEGSKFMTESFIKAILGFFMKMLFCSLAICLMIYGFSTLFFVISIKEGFQGTVDQIIFVVFTCLLFFYICKSAPGMAQALLSGSPSLSATGAISAAGGALAAAAGTMGMAKAAGGMAKSATGGLAKAGMAGVSTLSEAGAAAGAAKALGGSGKDQRGAFMSSLAGSAKSAVSAGALGLARSITGGASDGYKQRLQDRKAEGRETGLAYMAKQETKANANKPVKD